MKIDEKSNDIKFRGAKMKVVDRPKELSKFLNHFGLSLIIGLPASGKSSLIKNLLMGTKEDRLYNKIFHSVYYISPSTTMGLGLPEDKYIKLDDKPLEVILQEIVDKEKEQGAEDDPHRLLIVLDDAINFLKGNKEALNLYRKLVYNARHILGDYSSVSMWIVSQKIRAIPLAIRSQANSIYFFDSTAKEKEVFLDEFLPLDKVDGQQLFDYVYEEPYSFIYVNIFMPKNQRVFKKFNQLILSDLKSTI